MYLSEILKMRDFDISTKTKIVRHKDNDKNYDLDLLYDLNMLDFYQSVQSKDVFKDCDYIISFIGEAGTKSRLVGIYKVIGYLNFNEISIPKNYPHVDSLQSNYFYYKLEKTEFLNDLENRLVIDWGKGTVSWHQWLSIKKDKEVIEILPIGFCHPFPGYEDVCLSFLELQTIIKNPIPNRKWKEMLSAVFGIYLIVDITNGSQYVGSAYGEQNSGIWGRWEQYVNTKHGSNKKLIELLEREPERYKFFQFAILRTLPKSLTAKEVILFEQKYKKVLGSKVFGLNSN